MATYTEERAAILRDFGLKVARLRAEPRGSQEAFAHEDKVRLHRNAIGVIERGECEPGLLTLLILADAFEGDSFWELLEKSRGASTAPAATAPNGVRHPSSNSVTGPSLTSSTTMCAPNTPR